MTARLTDGVVLPPRILVVEDDPDDVLFLKRAFFRVGVWASILVVEDGEDALAYIDGRGRYADRAEHPAPDCLLLDLKLPRRSGLELLRWVRSHPTRSALRVIVLTSSSHQHDVDAVRALGVDAFFVKPVAFADLTHVAREIAAIWGIEPVGADPP